MSASDRCLVLSSDAEEGGVLQSIMKALFMVRRAGVQLVNGAHIYIDIDEIKRNRV